LKNSTLSSNTCKKYQKIGLFDSGVGGLLVLRRLAAAFPRAQFVYLGDTARLPYGNRSRQEVAGYVQEIVGFLSDFNLDALVMACNTSAALAQDVALRSAVSAGFDLHNLIQPAADYLAASNVTNIGVLATSATARSRAFGRALEALNFRGAITEIGCPRLVPLIESGRLNEYEIESALTLSLQDYLQKMAGAEVILLGCTHFPYLTRRIEALVKGPLNGCFPASVQIVDPANYLAPFMGAGENNSGGPALYQAPDMVTQNIEGRCPANLDERVEIFTTADGQAFMQKAKLALGDDFFAGLTAVKQISVSTLAQSEKERQARMITRSGSHPPILLQPTMAPAGLFA
jgi:glutamate racemase